METTTAMALTNHVVTPQDPTSRLESIFRGRSVILHVKNIDDYKKVLEVLEASGARINYYPRINGNHSSSQIKKNIGDGRSLFKFMVTDEADDGERIIKAGFAKVFAPSKSVRNNKRKFIEFILKNTLEY